MKNKYKNSEEKLDYKRSMTKRYDKCVCVGGGVENQ